MEFSNARKWHELHQELHNFAADLHELAAELPAGHRIVARMKINRGLELARSVVLRAEQGENELARRLEEHRTAELTFNRNALERLDNLGRLVDELTAAIRKVSP